MIRLDAVKHHFDDNGIFFARELESIEAKLYEFKKRELKYREYIPVDNSDPEGAEETTYYMFDKVGMAKIIANYADDLPRCDVFGQLFTQKVRGVGTSFGYNTQEVRAAQTVGRPLESMKADAARRVVREKEARIAWNGDSSYNLQGFLGNANVPTGAVPNGALATPEWSTKTALEILSDISTGVSTIRSQSKGIHEADTLLLPIEQYNLISLKPIGDNADKTILQFIKSVDAYGLTTVDWISEELDLAFTGDSDGAIYYERNSEVIVQKIPLEMITHPVQERGLEFIIPVESRHGGTTIRYPLAVYFQYDI